MITLTENVKTYVLNALAEILHIQVQDLDPEEDLSEYGLDSITQTELAIKLDEYYGISVSPAILFEHRTLKSFIQYMVDNYQPELESRHGKVLADVPSEKSESSGPMKNQPTSKTEENKNRSENISNENLSEKVKAYVLNTLAEILHIQVQDLDPEEDLSEYGLDSITQTELAIKLDEYYGISVSPAILFEHRTLKSFIQYMVDNYQPELEKCHGKVNADVPSEKSESSGPMKNQPTSKTEENKNRSENISNENLSEKVKAYVLNTLAEILHIQVQDLDPEEDLSEYGLDSITQTELAIKLDEYYGISVSPAILFEHRTLKSFIQYMVDNYQSELEKCHGKALAAAVPSETIASPETMQDKAINQAKENSNRSENLSGTNLSNENLSEKVKTYVLNTLAEILHIQVQDLNPEEDLSEYGLDSITQTELAIKLDEYYGISVSPAVLFEHRTLKSFIQYLIQNYFDALKAGHRDQPSNVSEVAAENIQQPQQTESPLIEDTDIQAKEDVIPVKTKEEKEEKGSKAREDIAIIGMSGVFPGSPNIDVLWKNLDEQRDLISEIPKNRWNPKQTKVKAGGFIEEIDMFDAEFFKVSRYEAMMMDPQHRILMQTVWSAIENSGYIPKQFADVKTGLFVGISSYDYYELEPEGEASSYFAMGIAHSMVANRISYFLNLHGPSEAIDTACSSSLFAIHNAVMSIHNADCEMAIVCGVNALLTPKLFKSFYNAGMLSNDGRCKTFDKSANGYARGEGVGSIILKPLSRAEADGDTIYGVIKGTAVNHGGHVSALTAPNPNAQAEVIINAVEQAGIDVDTISYVETHGTGTLLGDPIEINGLKKAFNALNKVQSTSKGYCGLGSIKTNIGHLESASGIASVIKVLLSMHHKKIPGIVHFKELNPHIDIKDSPFYIAEKTQKWDQQKNISGKEVPRRAGISSFGFGGANCHIVIEEYTKEKQIIHANKPYYLIAMSAKTDSALEQKMKELANWLVEHTDASLEDISYTLNIGRMHFNKRCALIVSTLDELKQKLINILNDPTTLDYFHGSVNKTAQKSAIFNKVLQITSQEIKAKPINDNKEYKNNLEILAELYVKGYELDWNGLHQDESKCKVSLPTYPFSKKHYWIEIKSDATSTHENETYAHPLLDNTIPKSYSYTKLFTGDEFYLNDHKVNNTRVLPGVIYLEMARSASKMLNNDQHNISFQKITWIKPLKISDKAQSALLNLDQGRSGTVDFNVKSLTADNETLVHMQGKMIFELQTNNPMKTIDVQAIKNRCSKKQTSREIYSLFENIGLQYGASFQAIQDILSNDTEAIATLELPQHLLENIDQFVLHPSLLDGALQAAMGLLSNESTNYLYLPFSLEQLDILSAMPNKCYAYVRLSPKDQTNQHTFNIQVADENGCVLIDIKNFVVRLVPLTEKALNDPVIAQAIKEKDLNQPVKENILNHRYVPLWKSKPLMKNKSNQSNINGPILIISDDETLQKRFQSTFNREDIILAKSGDNFKVLDDANYLLNLKNADDYHQLLTQLNLKNIIPKYIIYHNHFPMVADLTDNVIKNRLDVSYYAPLYLAQALTQQKLDTPVQLIYANSNADILNNLFVKAHSGFAKTLRLEKEKILSRVISFEDINDLIEELRSDEIEVQYNAQSRSIKRYHEITSSTKTQPEFSFKHGGVYLITGGAGGLGLIFANYLAKNYQAKLILIGRSKLNKTIESNLSELENYGAKVLYLSADVTNKHDLESAIDQAKNRFGHINGVIHSAGIIHDEFISKKTSEQSNLVISPKVQGSIYLDHILRDEQLDFFAMFSSITAIVGNASQCDYAYANAFLDEFASYRQTLCEQNQRSGKSLSINWPLWEEGGMKLNEAQRVWLEGAGLRLLSTLDGIHAFITALSDNNPQQIFLQGEDDKLKTFLDRIYESTKNKTKLSVVKSLKSKGNDEMLTDRVQSQLRQMITNFVNVKPDDINSEIELGEYGMDSISVISLTNNINFFYKLDLTPATLLDYKTIKSIASYLIKEHREAIDKYYMSDKHLAIPRS